MMLSMVIESIHKHQQETTHLHQSLHPYMHVHKKLPPNTLVVSTSKLAIPYNDVSCCVRVVSMVVVMGRQTVAWERVHQTLAQGPICA
jgi:hypothetical protein